MKPKVTFVVQRYGAEVSGGAESLCRWIAELMNGEWDVNVLTTCAQDYMTWRNVYPEGEDRVNGVQVHRFPVVRERNIGTFNKICNKLFRTHHPYLDELTLMKSVGPDGTKNDELAWMQAQGPDSPALLKHIERNQNDSDLFIFFTYMYATTYRGLGIASEKALLVPTAHDEPAIYLSIFEDFFRKPKGFIFSTPEEKNFVVKKFNIDCTFTDIIGVGVRDDFREVQSRLDLPDNYVIYVGRLDESKGCGELFDFWARYKQNHPGDLRLVLVGSAHMRLPSRKDIVSIGFVEESEKAYAISNAKCLIVPSLYESFSIVLLEAWLCGVSVLVNGRCQVLKGQCRRANGGLWYESYDEFDACLSFILHEQSLASEMAASGKRYTELNYSWDTIKRKYVDLIQKAIA